MDDLSEVLERFRRGAELLSVATTGASNPELDFAPAPGSWTSRQIAAHLADAECVGAMRFRQVIAEDEPTLIPYDQNAWAERLDYGSRKIGQILETFRRLRADNYELLRNQPDGAFSRGGHHPERGWVNLGDLLRIYADHAEAHARQILEARQAYKNRDR